MLLLSPLDEQKVQKSQLQHSIPLQSVLLVSLKAMKHGYFKNYAVLAPAIYWLRTGYRFLYGTSKYVSSTPKYVQVFVLNFCRILEATTIYPSLTLVVIVFTFIRRLSYLSGTLFFNLVYL